MTSLVHFGQKLGVYQPSGDFNRPAAANNTRDVLNSLSSQDAIVLTGEGRKTELIEAGVSPEKIYTGAPEAKKSAPYTGTYMNDPEIILTEQDSVSFQQHHAALSAVKEETAREYTRSFFNKAQQDQNTVFLNIKA